MLLLEHVRSARDDHVQLMNSYRQLHPLHPTAPHLRVRPAPLPEELRRLVTLRRPRATRNDGLHLGDRARAEREVLDVRRRGGHDLGGVPPCAVRTVRPRLEVPSTYGTWGPGGKPLRLPYVPNAAGSYA